MQSTIITDYMEAVWNKKDLSVIRDVFDKGVIVHSALGDVFGPRAMEAVVEAWLSAFEDMTIEVINTATSDNLVIVQWRAEAHHSGEFHRIPATGKKVRYSGVSVHKLDGSKVIEYWAYLDMKSVLDQIAAATAATGQDATSLKVAEPLVATRTDAS